MVVRFIDFCLLEVELSNDQDVRRCDEYRLVSQRLTMFAVSQIVIVA